MKKALITGQDGAYLAELLLEKGYEVHGIKRRSSLFNTARIGRQEHLAAMGKTKVGELHDRATPPRMTCSWLQSNWQASPGIHERHESVLARAGTQGELVAFLDQPYRLEKIGAISFR